MKPPVTAFSNPLFEVLTLPRATAVIDGMEMVLRVPPADEFYGTMHPDRYVLLVHAEQSPDVQAFLRKITPPQNMLMHLMGMPENIMGRVYDRMIPAYSIVFDEYIDVVKYG